MPKGPGKEFEGLVKEIAHSLARLDGLEVLDVQPSNTSKKFFITGSSGSEHQIDAYLKVRILGQELEIVFEAKDWAKPVDKPRVMTFVAVLLDLPRRPQGVIVTKSGFDKGNIIPISKHHNMSLYVLDELTSPKEFGIKVECIGTGVIPAGIRFVDNSDQHIANEAMKHKKYEEIVFFDKRGSRVFSLKDLLIRMERQCAILGIPVDKHISADFGKDGLFISTKNRRKPRVAIRAIRGRRFEVLLDEQMQSTRFTHLLHLITNDQRYYVDQDLKVHKDVAKFSPTFEFQDPKHGKTIKLQLDVNYKLPPPISDSD